VEALNTNDGQPRVAVIDDTNTAQIRTVQLGVQSSTQAEILSGLTDDQLVATSGVANLHDGDVVAPRMGNLVTASTGIKAN
jgi:multidrug efflux pump subunit AcrA (membrane-fusion protein)